MSERISRSLLAACKDSRDKYPDAADASLWANALSRVDHVVMGTTGNVFAVAGRLDDPAHKLAFVSVEEAIRTPVEQSDEKLRSEEHTSELQSLMRISYAVFCLKKKKIKYNINITHIYIKTISHE